MAEEQRNCLGGRAILSAAPLALRSPQNDPNEPPLALRSPQDDPNEPPADAPLAAG